LTGRQGWPWLLLLLFTPVGYVVGSRAIASYDRHAQLGLAVTRDEAIAIARRFVSSKGFPADKASVLATLEVDSDLRRYAVRYPAAGPLTRAFVPSARIHVSFSLPKNRASVFLAPDGRIVAWDLGTPDSRGATVPSNTPPAGDAEKALQAEFGVAEAAKFQSEGSSREKEGREIFTSRRRFAELPGLSIRSAIPPAVSSASLSAE
jgi:hypothetical protein